LFSGKTDDSLTLPESDKDDVKGSIFKEPEDE